MLGIGMALPGPFDVESMSFVGPTTMAGWGNVQLRERLAEVTGLPAFIETDMAAAALGERLYGAAPSSPTSTISSSASASAAPWCMTAWRMRGAWGNAGEIGHIPVVPDGEPCPCGNRGCLERYLSLEAFTPPRPQRSRLRRCGQPATARRAIITIENLFDPETIILGGLAPDNAHRRAGPRRRRPAQLDFRPPATARLRASSSPVADRTPCCAARRRWPSPACCRRASARCSPPAATTLKGMAA